MLMERHRNFTLVYTRESSVKPVSLDFLSPNFQGAGEEMTRGLRVTMPATVTDAGLDLTPARFLSTLRLLLSGRSHTQEEASVTTRGE